MTEQKGTFAEIHPQESSDDGSSPIPSAASRPCRSDGIPGAVSGSSGGEQGLAMRNPRMARYQVSHGFAGATLAPASGMHLACQGKPALMLR
jgi:hypothetical protein